MTEPEAPRGSASDIARKVFVVHGRNEPARAAVFTFLRSIGLEPIEWNHARSLTGKASPYIGEILTAAFDAAQAVVVLQTPDEVAYLVPQLTHEGDPDCDPHAQPRPNVMFEAGIAMGRDESRVVLVEFGSVQAFSDVHGRHVVRLDNSVGKRQDLAVRLRDAGCSVQLDGNDWHTAGDLTPPEAPGGGLALGRRLPSSRTSSTPRLDATYTEGSKGSGTIHITNHGPGDVLELNWEPPEGNAGLLRDGGDFPLARLPQAKSVKIRMLRTLAHGWGSHLNLRVTGKTEDGRPIDETLFVSL